MVVYDLICDGDHRFEGWFKSEGDYHQQLQQGLLACPVCASEAVRRIPSASYIQTGKGRASHSPSTQAAQSGTAPGIDFSLVEEFRQFLAANTEDVGREFAEEAKKMHYGEAEARAIRGEASLDEVIELREEGIDALLLPGVLEPNKKLN